AGRKPAVLIALRGTGICIDTQATGHLASPVPMAARKTKITSTAASKPKRAATAPKRPYADLHEHLRALDKAGLLVTVDRRIDKDTEMHPLVRWQFRGGIEEKDR